MSLPLSTGQSHTPSSQIHHIPVRRGNSIDASRVPGINSAPEKKRSRYFCVSWITLAAILLLAFFLRVYNIENIPAGLYPDEATNATDAMRALETGEFRFFYENNYGREGLFINLQALALKYFGLSIPALKLWSIVFGTLTVLGVYLLAWELWQKRFVALTAGYFTAVSFWAINFSRIGFRAIMVPLLLTFAFYFFLRGLRTKSYLAFALAGFIFALGLHTYIAYRLAPLILVVFFIGLILSHQHFFKVYFRHALVFIVFASLSAAPMFWDFYVHPDHFISRSTSISIFEPNVNHGDPAGTLARTFGLSLIKYNFWGDQNWRHNYPPYPILDPLTGLFFLAGFLYLIPRTVRLLVRRFKNGERNKELAYCFLFFGWFLVMNMPEFLTDEGLPHALRAIGTLPVVMLIAATPFLWIGEWAKEKPSFAQALADKSAGKQYGFRIAAISFLAIVFATIGTINTVKYFVFFANNPHQHGAFNENYKNMALYLRSLPPNLHKYVLANAGGTQIDNGLPVTAQPIVFLTKNQVANLEFLKPETKLHLPAVIVFMSYDGHIVEQVQQYYPAAQVEKVDLNPGFGSDFTVIHLP